MNTPHSSHPHIASILQTTTLYLKREDLGLHGSHKGRAIPKMIDYAQKAFNHHHFTISSTGNAALSAIQKTIEHNSDKKNTPIFLEVYIGHRIPPKKKAALTDLSKDPHITIRQVSNPKQQAFQKGQAENTTYLRQSTDSQAPEFYHRLAAEITTTHKTDHIFVATSSGTTAQGIGEYLVAHHKKTKLHIVQTTTCPTIASYFDKKFIKTENSIATCIGDKVGHRKKTLIGLIEKTKGSGWVVSDKEILQAQNILEKELNETITPNQALSLAGALKAKKSGWTLGESTTCIISGK